MGLLGDGQLAQMTCLAGQALGLEMHVYAQSADSPAAQVADRVWLGAFDDEAQLRLFAEVVEAVTYDTELLPIVGVRRVAELTRAYPAPDILYIAQNRIRERAFLRSIDISMPRVAAIEEAAQAEPAALAVGLPAILKTAEQGYDGKGQQLIERLEDIEGVWREFGEVPCVLEECIEFVGELSVIVAGGLDGHFVAYPVIDNDHRKHILHVSSAPSQLPADVQATASALALRIAQALSLVGLLAVEMFYTRDGRVLINELAPRPHNSGHHTQISGAASQFEQLCRAVMGMPLGPVLSRPAAMVNLLGELFVDAPGEPPIYQHAGFVPASVWRDYVQVQVQVPYAGMPEIDSERMKLYFYGKSQARDGRKMGHAIVVGETTAAALAEAQALYDQFALVARNKS